jgi:thymidine phosphorylase
MISGRGLGHTGGTLDKLDSIPGYRTAATTDTLRTALRHAGCAIVGQTADIAPADKRLYAIRDVTATVESLPLITASILSKKLAAGLQGLVMDVKTGNGAFASTRSEADALAQSLVNVAQGAGLPTRAWITDMNQVLGRNCGNALEVREAIAFLTGEAREPRLLEITRQLSAELLLLGKRATQRDAALHMVDQALSNGAAVEKFAHMVSILGGPSDLVERPRHYLAAAPEERPVLAQRGGWVTAMDTRQIGLLLIELGAGRRQASDSIDARVGLTDVVSIGQRVERGDLLARVHAATPAAAEAASKRLAALLVVGDAMVPATPVMIAGASH